MDNIVNNITELLLLLFIAITFLQSGLDKAFDWKGNVGWLKEHFGQTFMRNSVPAMVGVVLVTEILAGILAIIGFFEIILYNTKEWALAASVIAALTLLMLLFGQRVAKDYAGAFTITGYFVVTMAAVYLFGY